MQRLSTDGDFTALVAVAIRDTHLLLTVAAFVKLLLLGKVVQPLGTSGNSTYVALCACSLSGACSSRNPLLSCADAASPPAPPLPPPTPGQ